MIVPDSLLKKAVLALKRFNKRNLRREFIVVTDNKNVQRVLQFTTRSLLHLSNAATYTCVRTYF